MARSVCHFADQGDDGKRLDVVLLEHGLYKSRSAAARAIDSGDVLVLGSPVQKSHIVSQGDAIVCNVEDAAGLLEIQGEDIPLDVRYEDEHLAVISKQPYLVCHPTDDIREGTLVNALIHRYGRNGLCNVQGEDDRHGIVHRLDADTSGLMLIAKDDMTGQALMDDIRLRNVDRRYLTLVHGNVVANTGLIDAPIGRNPKNRLKRCVSDGTGSREALTTFKTLERLEGNDSNEGYSLLECKLYTGRTHQIRVHMEYIRHPVVGDPLYTSYGPKDEASQLGLNRQFLHSFKIGFNHPISGEHMEFEDDLPEDLASALGQARKMSE